MDQSEAPIVAALAAGTRTRSVSFGAPGHHQGKAAPDGMTALVGKRAFRADILTPKGLDDRTESLHAVQRAHELAAEAWGADLCRFATGGSTQSLHTALASLARAGDTVLLAANAHKAEFAAALFAGFNPVVVPVEVDEARDLELGVAVGTLERLLGEHPDAKAVVIVSPNYYGITSDVAGLAEACHARGVPLIVDAAWGGAFAFSSRLPVDALACGADVMVCSLHKTMGALGQGSVMLARGDLVDQQRFALAYELFETTSPSVPILASIDATRRDHALNGSALWGDVLDKAAGARAALAAIDGVVLLGREDLVGAGGDDVDDSKIVLDVTRLGITGYAADDWLYKHHGITVGLSDARHLLFVLSPGTTRSDIRKLERGLRNLVHAIGRDRSALPPAPSTLPRIAELSFEMAMPGAAAFFADTELVRYEDAAGRIAAEIIAPAPPGIPRLIPGQRITPAHVQFLVANRDAGFFVLDPTDPSEHCVRVVAAAGA